MANGEVIISGNSERYAVKVTGRATFECVPPLRELSGTLEKTEFKKVDIDLSGCQSMDSTFMGILAMMALRAKKISAVISIYNADDFNKNLLYGLGLKKLFAFVNGTFVMEENQTSSATSQDQIARATTVLEAHKTLMNVDEGNITKFEKVVDFVQKDLDRLNGK